MVDMSTNGLAWLTDFESYLRILFCTLITDTRWLTDDIIV